MTDKIFRERDLKKIVKYWGKEKQQIKAIEEMSELTKELCKNSIGQIDIKHIEEEIADVQIMLNQLMLIHSIDPATITYHMNMKIRRTVDIIDGLERSKG